MCWPIKLRCFPHVINLACKVVLAAITHMEYAKDIAGDYVPSGLCLTTFVEAISRDPIATVCSLVRGVCTCLSQPQLHSSDYMHRSVHHPSDDNTSRMF